MAIHEEFVYEILNKMESHKAILTFSGEFDMQMINALVSSVREKLVEVEPNIGVQKKVYNVMVECLENIYRHSEDTQQKNVSLRSFAVFTLHSDEGDYFITTGNYVNSSSISYLKNTIDKINTLSLNDRKNMYREILKNGEFSAKGGAGLGMIDIALKSNARLDYQFKESSDGSAFYIFQVNIHKGKENKKI